MRAFKPVVVSFLLLSLVGCTTAQTPITRLTKPEVEQIAVAVAQKAGEHLEDYQAPRVSFDSRQQKWFVMFDQKPPGVPGGYVFISVDDKSGVGTLIPSD